jgi:hypothetical protein
MCIYVYVYVCMYVYVYVKVHECIYSYLHVCGIRHSVTHEYVHKTRVDYGCSNP